MRPPSVAEEPPQDDGTALGSDGEYPTVEPLPTGGALDADSDDADLAALFAGDGNVNDLLKTQINTA